MTSEGVTGRGLRVPKRGGAGLETTIVLDRSAAASLACGGIVIVAGGIIAAVNSAAPFERGSWLAAYLVLVGGVAQIALGAGRLALRAPPRRGRPALARLLLWNLGSLAVPAGVLAGAAEPVTSGSVALLCALLFFAAEARGAPARARRAAIAYRVLVVGLAASVVVGSALAGAAPGAWL